jgi:hypothetical protein
MNDPSAAERQYDDVEADAQPLESARDTFHLCLSLRRQGPLLVAAHIHPIARQAVSDDAELFHESPPRIPLHI